MRIQHNIMAMNAYRNYTSNVSAMKQNLEKLSSGYKINRAGDDAAGLAISEKMRAQITGLETAQKNAKDGISLVQTAEGAMTEVHDMLNRMVELATQSANGTYDNTTDRAQMQKEMDQLNSEINRIADSANFNGIKLLNGDLDSEVKKTISDTTFSGVSDALLDVTGGGQGWEVIKHKEGQSASKTSFEVDFSNFKVELGKEGSATITFGMVTDGDDYNDVITSTTTEDALHGLDTTKADSITEVAGKTDDNGKWEVTIASDENGTITGEDIVNELVKKLNESGVATDDKGTVKLKNDSGVEIEYKVSVVDGKKLKFEMTDDGFADAVKYYKQYDATDADKSKYLHVFDGNYNIGMNVKVGTDDAPTSGLPNLSTSTINKGSVEKGVQLADVLLAPKEPTASGWNSDHIKDGGGVKIGDEYYVFAATDKTFNADYSGNVKVVDIRDLWDADNNKLKEKEIFTAAGATQKSSVEAMNTALSRLTEAADGNKMWSVELTRNDQGRSFLSLREREDYNGNGKDGRADLTTKDGIKETLKFFSTARAHSTETAATGKSLTLQIGDTAEDFNQLKVNISDMHAASLGLDKISIADQASAAKAVDVIKAAINTVSDVRGTLGATQNRLDHTINNLSVMTENIQDAESTIRDTDVAAEMMKYTKNNILIQSAQAMLAQANQVPQGVLQLLQ